MKKRVTALISVFFVLIVAAALVFGIKAYVDNNIPSFKDTDLTENKLQTITDENIIKMDVGATKLKKSKALISPQYTFSSEKFSGVSEVYYKDCVSENFEISLSAISHTKGNLKIVLLLDDEIVHAFKINEYSQRHKLENISGRVSLRVAGESAKFKFTYEEKT
ncbi:MAG: hypothetical protein IJ262_03920 [Clostridia bacterium]|nr:hypothetical protein [Clostridia bacterium]